MKKCFECGATNDIQDHHVVPRSRGGTKTVPLCYTCHMKAHGRDSRGMNHKKLTKAALAQAKLKGVLLGSNIPSVKLAAEEGKSAKGTRTITRLTSVFLRIRKEGFTTGQAMADTLNNRGILSASGKPWTRSTARSMWKRIEYFMSTEDK